MSQEHIDLRSLRYVLELSRIRSFHRAAESLGITQSALTRSIQGLERRFDVRLFDRGRAGVRATSVGLELAARAESLLLDARNAARSLRMLSVGDVGKVAFGMSPLLAKAGLGDFLGSYLRRHPAVQANVAVRSAEDLLTMLTEEEIDFVVASAGAITSHPRLRVVALGSARSRLLVRAGHPLADATGVDEAACRAFPFILSTWLERRASRVAQVPNAVVEPTFVSNDYGALLAFALNTDAIWITSDVAFRGEIEAGLLAVLPALPGMTFDNADLVSARLAGRSLSPASAKLLVALEGRLRSLFAEGATPARCCGSDATTTIM